MGYVLGGFWRGGFWKGGFGEGVFGKGAYVLLPASIRVRVVRSPAVGRWFPPGTPVSSTRKLISSSFHRLDMTLAVAEALNPNKPKPKPVADIDHKIDPCIMHGLSVIE